MIRVAFIVFAGALASCNPTPPNAIQLDQAKVRWGLDAWQEVHPQSREAPGRNGQQSFEQCFSVPKLSVDDPALFLENIVGLEHATADGVRISVDAKTALLPLPVRDGPMEVCLHYAGESWLRMTRATAGSQHELTRARQRAEMPAFALGVVFFVLGLALLLVSLPRTAARGYRWMGLFALGASFLSVAQAISLRWMFPIADWAPITLAGMTLLPVGVALFAREVFGDVGPKRSAWVSPASLLLRVSIGFSVASVALLCLHLWGLVPLHESYRVAYLFMLPLVGIGAWYTIALRREKRHGANLWLAGVGVLMLFGIPDILLGIVNAPYTLGLTPVGALLFLFALGAIVEQSYRHQATVLRATSTELRQRVDQLEDRGREIGTLNEELRHQLERRSRELQRAMAEVSLAHSPAAELANGAVLDHRYRIERKLGAGAMGAVYEVVRQTDDRRLAVKVMIGVLTADQAQRFAREAEIAAKLRHANLVPLVDVGVDPRGIPYLVMELVTGTSLEEQRERFGDHTWALPLLSDVARGLHALHHAGIMHRDLKPSNILIDADAQRARIADFGIARPDRAIEFAETMPPNAQPLVARPALTEPGAWIGTPLYMPPEAARGDASLSGDVFALGVIIHELLTGNHPFVVPPFFAARAGVDSVPQISTKLDARAEELIRRCLAQEPDQRPTAAQVLASLEELASGT